MKNLTPKPKTLNPKFVDIDNAREDDQREVMKEIIEAGHCPFCEENLRTYHKQAFLKEGTYWLITLNQWPYNFTKHHFLLIYKDHAEHLSELNPEAGKELLEFVAWIEKKYNVPGGGWAMRFGDTKYSAGTVNHLHIQFIVPDIDAPDFQPTRLKIGKGKK